MFDSSLGVYPHKKFHIDIDPDTKPVHSQAYPVPHIYLHTFKKELDHLVELGALKESHENERCFPVLLYLKRMVEFVGSLTYANSIKWLNTKYTRYQSSMTYFKNALATNFSPNLT